MARQKSVDATANGAAPVVETRPSADSVAALPKHVRKHIKDLARPRSVDRNLAGPSSPRADGDVEKGHDGQS